MSVKIFISYVIKGKSLGKQLGYPTINLRIESNNALNEGVYAGVVDVNGQRYKAAIAVAPKKEDSSILVEAHLLDYEGDELYGEIARVAIIDYISAWEKFDNQEDLTSKIKNDVEKVRKLDINLDQNL